MPEIVGVLAWLVPGLGHFCLGKRIKGAIFSIVLISTFVVGILTAGRGAISVQDHKYAFLAQIGAGGPTLTTLLISSQMPKVEQDARKIDPLFDIGLLYTMVAGLLNIVVVCDAFETAVRGKVKHDS